MSQTAKKASISHGNLYVLSFGDSYKCVQSYLYIYTYAPESVTVRAALRA